MVIEKSAGSTGENGEAADLASFLISERQVTSTARWWCRWRRDLRGSGAEGPAAMDTMISGRSRGRRDRKALDECRSRLEPESLDDAAYQLVNASPIHSRPSRAMVRPSPVTIMREPALSAPCASTDRALLCECDGEWGSHLAQAQSAALRKPRKRGQARAFKT